MLEFILDFRRFLDMVRMIEFVFYIYIYLLNFLKL